MGQAALIRSKVPSRKSTADTIACKAHRLEASVDGAPPRRHDHDVKNRTHRHPAQLLGPKSCKSITGRSRLRRHPESRDLPRHPGIAQAISRISKPCPQTYTPRRPGIAAAITG